METPVVLLASLFGESDPRCKSHATWHISPHLANLHISLASLIAQRERFLGLQAVTRPGIKGLQPLLERDFK